MVGVASLSTDSEQTLMSTIEAAVAQQLVSTTIETSQSQFQFLLVRCARRVMWCVARTRCPMVVEPKEEELAFQAMCIGKACAPPVWRLTAQSEPGSAACFA